MEDIIAERCDFQAGDYIGEKYVIEKLLGEGAFGKVFKVNDRASRQLYALKLFKFWELPSKQRQAMASRFQMEYETGQIKSNYLVRSVGSGKVKGNPYIVMEFLPNGDLCQLVSNNRNVDLVKIGREILCGLKDLHRCGKVHRDLKPENVLIKADGSAALTDFGISGDRQKRITVEFLPNGDLCQLVSNNRHVDLVKIGREILCGLKDLHRCGKVHRDLKPENVLIKADGSAALTDFGISGDRQKRITVTDLFGRPTEIAGTVAYMAPEQAKPKNREVTVLPTMDIFAFGVMMYQLITDEFPFGPLTDENELVLYIQNAREGKWNRSRLANHPVGKKFDEVLAGCLMSDYKQRLQTVDMVLSLMPQSAGFAYESAGSLVKHNIVNGVLLRIMQGEEHGAVYKLNELLRGKSRIITVGCNDPLTNNLMPIVENLSHFISRKHCTIELSKDNQWFIRDGQWDKSAADGWKKSLNGTFVNSTEVSVAGMPFRPGDIISIGDVKLRVEGY